MDVIEATGIRIHMYKVKKPADEIIKQAQILNDAAKKIKEIIHGLRDMKNSQMILDGCVEINTLENAGDGVLRTIITDLFMKATDAIELIKWKNISNG